MKRNLFSAQDFGNLPSSYRSGVFTGWLQAGFGVGYIRKGGGTVAAVLCCGVWYLAGSTQAGDPSFGIPLMITVFITALGIWSATVVERQWGKDSYRVVIDEVAGMCLTLLFIPVNVSTILVGLVLFRLFDIFKPLGIRRLEKLRGGWGVMFDDLLAGLYANLLLQGAVALNLL